MRQWQEVQEVPREEQLKAASSIQRFSREPVLSRWLAGGHVQTILGHLLPCAAPRMEEIPNAREVRVATEDGEELLVHEIPPRDEKTEGVQVLLLHGLSGDANADYMRRTVARLRSTGHGIWSVNHRGCGAGKGLAYRPYHAGKTEDLQALLRASRDRFPARRIVVIGFSLGANLALLHAAQDHELQPDGIVAVSPPVDIERATLDLGRGLGRLYQLRFLLRLRRAVAERVAAGRTRRAYRIRPFASLLEFDDTFTAPECGFEDGRDYYRRASSAPHLARVGCPTALITAADDPFVDARVYEDLTLSPSILLHVVASGGHVGYLERIDGRWQHWIDDAIEHYVAELCSTTARG